MGMADEDDDDDDDDDDEFKTDDEEDNDDWDNYWDPSKMPDGIIWEDAPSKCFTYGNSPDIFQIYLSKKKMDYSTHSPDLMHLDRWNTNTQWSFGCISRSWNLN